MFTLIILIRVSSSVLNRTYFILCNFIIQLFLLFESKMPPKAKPAAPSKKTEAKKKEKVIEVGP